MQTMRKSLNVLADIRKPLTGMTDGTLEVNRRLGNMLGALLQFDCQ